MQVGDSASFTKTITNDDVLYFAQATGDMNPIHLEDEYAAKSRFGRRIAHGLLTAGLISAVIGTKLPGPGAIYLGQSLRFEAPAGIGDTITATCTVTSYDPVKRRATLETICANQAGVVVLTGEAVILVPEAEAVLRNAAPD